MKFSKKVAIAVVATSSLILSASPAFAGSINGSGASFALPLIDACKVEFTKDTGHTVNYPAGGSGKGRSDFAANLVDFAASDAVYTSGFPAHLEYAPVYAAGIADRRADTLPYPVTKRVAIARALVSEPRILLLDEPAGGLGIEDTEWMNSIIHNLATQCSVILVEHHMDVVMSVCDRLYVLNFGEVIASGDVENVRRDPAVIAAYLGVNN